MNRRLVAAGGWLAGGLAGWIIYRLVFSAAGTTAGRAAGWGFAAVAAVAIAFRPTLTWLATRPPARAFRPLVLGVGWAFATAIGWFFDVRLGGAWGGVVAGMVCCLDDDADRGRLGRLALIAAAVLAALALGRLAVETTPWILGNLVILGVGLAGYGIATRIVGSPPLPWQVAGLMLGWGVAWSVAFRFTSWLNPPNSARFDLYAFAGLEMVLAFGLGGILMAWATRNDAGPAAVAGWWALGGLLGVVVGMAVDIAVTLVLPRVSGAVASGFGGYLDVGQVVGLGIGGWLAAAQTQPRLVPRVD